MKSYFYLFLIFFFVKTNVTAQSDIIDCANNINHIVLLIQKGDTSTALNLLEAETTKNCLIRNGQHRYFSRIYQQVGKIEEAKEQMQYAVEKGILGSLYFWPEESKLKDEIRLKYGEDYLQSLISLNDSIIKVRLEQDSSLIYSLYKIFKTDQVLRQDSLNKICRRYGNNFHYSPQKDTAFNHSELMSCYKSYRKQDSLALQVFTKLIDSIGYVPGDSILFGMLEIVPLIAHTGHFGFQNLDSIYQKSIELGTIPPAVYAWYKSTYEKWHKMDESLFFLDTPQQSSEQINSINSRRIKWGIPLYPATVWNTKLF